ncbi:MAG: VacJ family lipoprotein [Gallionellaceae bacterium]|jgi:phospholipid-binding lipoprotein MlaA
MLKCSIQGIFACSKIILLTVIFLSGCASAPASSNLPDTPTHKDPLENYNRNVYEFNEILDKAVLKPLAKTYDTVLPEPAKILSHNFFSNLDDVTVTLNDLLQLKFKQAASDGSRVIFNSTFGVFGLLNVTNRLEKHNEDFGQTLGYWGIGSGPYFVLPFFGPSNFRDSVGLLGDTLTGVNYNMSDITLRNTLYIANKIEIRASLLDQESTLDEVSDPYAFIRDFYLGRRENLVYDGNPPRAVYIDEED